jgi:cyclic pyranopterin phosphate synthase
MTRDSVTDLFGRPLGALRISVTDRCNLRCHYCMPEESYTWLPREALLTFEELERVARAFVAEGVHKLRLTGGEPLLRRDLSDLVARLVAIAGVTDLALTTNGTLLAEQAGALHAAGLRRITISCDTLRADRMKAFARHDKVDDVVAGIDAALAAGFSRLKLNMVVVRGVNEDEVAEVAEFALARGIEPRFIEYMDVGGATAWTADSVVSREEILATLGSRFGPVTPLDRAGDPHAPAERYRAANGAVMGIVASTTAPFCRDCDRARLTADGTFFRCLYATDGIDLRTVLRDGGTTDDLRRAIGNAWRERSDRGAEERAALPVRGIFVPRDALRRDPHREMHVRGG